MFHTIRALNRQLFWSVVSDYGITDDNVEDLPVALISIVEENEPDCMELNYFKRTHRNFVQMAFSDVDKPERIGLNVFSPISFEQARELVGFIQDNIREKSTLLIHCAAGISRSGAVATFAYDLLKQHDPNRIPYEKFKRDNPQILPNRTVLAELRKAYEKGRSI